MYYSTNYRYVEGVMHQTEKRGKYYYDLPEDKLEQVAVEDRFFQECFKSELVVDLGGLTIC